MLNNDEDTVNYRSSPSAVFLRKGVLKICSRFTGENLSRSAISIKLTTIEVVYNLSSVKNDVWILLWILLLNLSYETKYNIQSHLFSIKEGAGKESTLFKAKWKVVLVKLAALLKKNFPYETFSNKVNKESNDTCRYPTE